MNSLKPVDVDYFEHAPHIMKFTEPVRASVERVWEAISADPSRWSWFEGVHTAGYASDDWRVRPDFTLQFGVRYEFFTPPSELYGHLANLDFDPAVAQVALVIPGQSAPFSGAVPASLIRPEYNHWAPRIGIAWDDEYGMVLDAFGKLQLVHPSPVEQIRAGMMSIFNTIGAIASPKSDVKLQHVNAVDL